MNLVILRHAKAYPRGEKFKPDRKRPITPEGEEIMRKAAEGMKALGLEFDLILTSSWLRAAQTARITAEVFKMEKVWQTENLSGDANPKSIVTEINDNYPSLNNILLVGHEPHLSSLISLLLTGDTDMAIDFKKSGLCKLAIKDLRVGRCAILEWLLTPKQLQVISPN